MKNHPLRNPSTGRLAAALALVLVPAVGSAQGVPGEGSSPGHESATADYRGLDDGPGEQGGADATGPAVGMGSREPMPSGTTPREAPEPEVAAASPAPRATPEVEAATTPIPITKLQASTETRRGNDPDEGATVQPEPRRPCYEYESALDAYTMFEESEGPDWVGANDRVGEIGGWKTYAREMYETAADGDEPMGAASDDGASE